MFKTISTRTKVLSGLGATAGLLYYYDVNPRHAYLSTRRVGTVMVASARCFSAYRKVLAADYQSPEARSDALAKCHAKCALITRKALETNGGVFIKLGQHISALTYIFPQEWTSAMIPLQDKAPISSFEDVQQLFLQDTGKPLAEQFEYFSPTPLGTASLAQVHVARLKDSHQDVAVKVQHPSLSEFVPLDIKLTSMVFNAIDFMFPEYPLTWLSDEMKHSMAVELDFTNEAQNAIKTQNYFRDYYAETALKIPDVIWAKKRILVMENVAGARPDNLQFLEEHNISRAQVSRCFANIFDNMIFTPGVGLHCDPHGGNLAIRPCKKDSKHPHNFEIVLYDHGLYRDVPTDMRRAYAHFWLSLLDGDLSKMKLYAKEFAGISDEQFPIFAAAITGRDFAHSVGDIFSERSPAEIENMSAAVTETSLISDIMKMLRQVPRVVLLILKTNDLTRHFDEVLGHPLGQKRTFLIMAQYCARTVYQECVERLNSDYGRWSLKGWSLRFFFWTKYLLRRSQVVLYDCGAIVGLA